MRVEAFLSRSVERFGQKEALVSGERRLTFAELDAQASRLAGGLAALGVRRGDRVVICLENGVEAVVAVFATLKAGAVFAVLNPTAKPPKLAYILRDSGASVLVTDARKAAAAQPALQEIPFLGAVVIAGPVPPDWPLDATRLISFDDLMCAEPDAGPSASRAVGIDADLAALVYTSGSTGQPKGVALTHVNIASAARSITTYLENTPDDVILNVLPLSFDYGLYQALMAVKVGARLVLERSFAYPHTVLELIAREAVTGFPIVPTVSAMLLQMDLAKYDLASLRYVTSTGAVWPEAHLRQLRSLWPHVRIYSMYGLTECKRVAYLPPGELDRRPTSVGKAMPNVEAWIVDENGRQVRDCVGELVVRGANVMQGYWGGPAETDRALRPGPRPGDSLLFTGDLFRADGEGFLYFVGRRDDMIKTRGQRVSPREVENTVYDLPAVAEAAVVGVPDPVLGQAVKVLVSLRPGTSLTEQDLLSHCARQLEDFMVPQIVEIVPALPKTSSGKIDRKALSA